MKTLVIYYSLEGNTKMIGELLAKNLDADTLEIKPVQEIENTKFMKYVWGGKQAVMKETPELLPYDKNPEDYDFLVIGTPVWAFTFSPPIRSFIVDRTFSEKKIAVFCCHGGSKSTTLEKMQEGLDGNEIISKCDFRDPKTRNAPDQLHKAIARAQELRDLISSPSNTDEIDDHEESLEDFESERPQGSSSLPQAQIPESLTDQATPLTDDASDETGFTPPKIPKLKKK